MARILLVDDEPATLRVLSVILEDEGYEVVLAKRGEEALSILAVDNEISVVVTDLMMPGIGGKGLFEKVRDQYPYLGVIILTAFGTVDSAVQAVKEGAFYYLTKPPDYAQLKEIIKKAVEHKSLMKEIHQLRQALQKNYSFANIIGKSQKMQEIFRLIRMVADSPATVLIVGESGTGKELVAKAVHYCGLRKDKPFVDVNCAAIPTNLLESEFFGHEKGSFTGAAARRIGRFEQANTGTLFLDEIGEIELPLQVKLLRAIQERKFERVGGNASVNVDIRLIAATNRDLRDAIKEGRFREDLYFRLNVIKIQLPPLRERREDIPLLVAHFLKKYSEQERKSISSASPAAMRMLMEYPWPGNVRELENVVERGAVICQGDTLEPHDLPYEISATVTTCREAEQGITLPQTDCSLSSLEKEMITRALEKSRGNKSKAANALGISRKVLYARLRDYGIEM